MDDMIDLCDWPAAALRVKVTDVQQGCLPLEISSKKEMIQPAMATPMAINLELVEYCRGEFDKEKKQYGVRVYFSSGNTLWLPGDTGQKFLATIESNITIIKDETTQRSLFEKFNEKQSSSGGR